MLKTFKELDDWEKAIDNGDLPVFKGYRLSLMMIN